MTINKIDLVRKPEWQLWKDENLVFVKSNLCDGKTMWYVYDANGEQIASTETKEFAFWVAKQNNLEPCCVN
ncbi:MAG: DUF1150 family protein [Alphaproteobacteria bacterium]|nr:DUF1150 family protein [Alphaproteobacteria bacterium]